MSGSNFDYDFGVKRNWRRWAWNRIAENISVPRKSALCFYLPGADNLDKEIALEKGFCANNLIGIERNRAALKKIRASGDLAIGCNFWLAMMSLAHKRISVNVAFGDFTSGYFPKWTLPLSAAMASPAFSHCIFALNYMRGRDDAARFGSVLERHFQNLVGANIRKHRGAISLLAAILLIVHEAKKQYPNGGWEKNTTETITRMVRAACPSFNSYKSESGQVFDSVVFNNFIFPKDEFPPAELIFDEYQQKVKIRTAKLDPIGRSQLQKCSKLIAATMAHRTMRMN